MEPTIKELREKLHKVNAIIRHQDDSFRTPALSEYRQKYVKSLRNQLRELTHEKLYQLPNLLNC